jgi:hypothetical protein
MALNPLDENLKVSYASGRFFMSGIKALMLADGVCSTRLFFVEIRDPNGRILTG